jgi:hypothetical protein
VRLSRKWRLIKSTTKPVPSKKCFVQCTRVRDRVGVHSVSQFKLPETRFTLHKYGSMRAAFLSKCRNSNNRWVRDCCGLCSPRPYRFARKYTSLCSCSSLIFALFLCNQLLELLVSTVSVYQLLNSPDSTVAVYQLLILPVVTTSVYQILISSFIIFCVYQPLISPDSTVSVYQPLISPVVAVYVYQLLISPIARVSVYQLLISPVVTVSVYQIHIFYHYLCLSATHLT